MFPLIACTSIISLSAQDEISDEELEALLSDDDALDAWLEEEFGGGGKLSRAEVKTWIPAVRRRCSVGPCLV